MAWRTAEDARRKKKQGKEEEQEQETRQIYKPGVERQKRQAEAEAVNASRREQAAKLGVGYLPGDVRVPGSPTQQAAGFTGDYRHDAMLADQRAQQKSAWDVAGVSQRVSQTINNGLGMMGIGQAPNSERDYMEMRRFYQLMEDAGRDSGNNALIDKARQGYGSYTARLDDIERQRGQQLANAGGIDKVDAYYQMYRNAISAGDTERAEYARSMINSQADSYNDELRFRRAPAATDTEGRANDWQDRYNRGQEGYVVGMMTGNQELVDRSRQYMEWANSNYGKAYGDLLTETQGPAAGYAYKYNLQELTQQKDAAWAKVEAARSAYDDAAEKANARAGEADYEWNANPRDDPTFAKEQEALAALRAAEADYEVWKQAIALEKGDEFAELEDRIPKAADKTNRTTEGAAVRGQILKGQAAFRRHEEEAIDKVYPNGLKNALLSEEEAASKLEEIRNGYAESPTMTNNTYQLRQAGYSFAMKKSDMGFGMTDEQKQTFFYLYAENPEKAEEFAEACKKKNEDAYYAEMSEAETNPAARLWKEFKGANLKLIGGAMPFSVVGQKMSKEGTALAQSVGAGREKYGVMNTGFLSGKLDEDIPIVGGKSLNDWTQLKSSMIMSGETAAAAKVAKVAMATGHPEAGAIAAIIEITGLYMQSGAAANDDYIQMKRNGWSDNAALTHALFAGVAEATFEKVSLESLVNQNISRGFVRNLLTQGGIEASEEVATTIANHITDAAIARVNGYDNDRERRAKEYMGQGMSYNEAYNKADVDIMTDLLDDALGGFLSGGLMTGGNYASQGLMTGAGKVVSGIRNTASEVKGLYNQDFGQWAFGGEDLHQGAAEGVVNRAINDRSGSITEAMRAYGEKNGLQLKNVKGAADGGQVARATNENSKASRRTTKTIRANVDTVTDSIADKMYSKAENVDGRMAGAVAVYEETVKEYGDGIKPVAKAALRNTVNKIVTETSNKGNVSATTAFQAKVNEIQNPEARDVVQDALDFAVYQKTTNATQRSEVMEGFRHLDESSAVSEMRAQRNKARGDMTMQATVTDENGQSKAVDITGITEDGKAVELSDGVKIDVKDMQADADTKDAIQMIASMELGTNAGKVLQAYRDSGLTGTEGYRFIADYTQAIEQGRTNRVSLERATKASSLDAKTVMEAYTIGQQIAHAETQKAMDRLKNAPKKKGATGRTATIDTSAIEGVTMSQSEREQFELANRIFSALGVDLRWVASSEKNGRYVGANGSYLNGAVTLDIHAGRNFLNDIRSGILATTGHELTHFLEQYAPEQYKALKEFVLQQIVHNGKYGEDTLERLIQEKKRRAKGRISQREAENEVVADACQNMLMDSKAVSRFAQEHEDAAKGIVRWLDKWFGKLKSAFTGSRLSEEARMMNNLEKDVKQAFGDLWDKALEEAVRMHDEIGSLEEESQGQNSDRDTEYLELAKDPEKNAARLQEMVDSAARKAGYTNRAYHGTAAEFTAFSKEKIGSAFFKDKDGFFFTTDKNGAKYYASASAWAARNGKAKVMDVVLQTKNPLIVESRIVSPVKYFDTHTEALIQKAKKGKRGVPYDSIIVTNDATSEYKFGNPDTERLYVVFEPEQIKSADPVTYDDSGNVIPLSERFNTENQDIRYSERDYKNVERFSPSEIVARNAVEKGRIEEVRTRAANSTEWQGRPILAYEGAGGLHALTGSHRLAVARLADYNVDAVVLREKELADLERYLQDETYWDLDDFMEKMDEADQAEILHDAVANGYKSLEEAALLMEEEIESNDARYSMRDYDNTVSDVDLLLQQNVEDAANLEQGRLLKEFQAKARQVQELEAKLEQVKAQLKRTDRSYNTSGIQKLIGDTMRTFGMGDAKNVGIRKTAAEMLNKAYDKAIAAIDRGDSAGALNEVYQGAVSVAEYLLDNGTYREKQGFRWDRAQWAQVYANTEEARQHAIDEVVSTVYNDFATNRYREAVQATAVDKIVDRVEAKYTEKLDAAKAQNKALQETNEKLEQDRDFFREVSDQTKDIADNLYTELKETREELKEAKRTNSKDTKRLQQKADKLAQDLKKANQQAKDWRDKAQHLGTFAQQLVDSKNRDIQGLRQDLAAAHEKLQAAASQIEEMKGWEEKAKHAGVYSQQLIDSKNRDIAKLEKEIQKHKDILAGKLRDPQLTALLKDARDAQYKKDQAAKEAQFAGYKDRRNRTDLKKRIRNLTDEMKRAVLRPTDTNYMPAQLATSMVDLLDVLEGHRVDMPGTGSKAEGRYLSASDAIRKMADAYEAIKDNPDNIVSSEYDEDFKAEIIALARQFERKTNDGYSYKITAEDMTTAELQQVYDTVRQLRDTMKNAAKVLSRSTFGNLYDAMGAIIEQQRSMKSRNRIGKKGQAYRTWRLNTLSTMRAAELMSGWDRSAALYQMVQAIEQGTVEADTWIMLYNKSMEALKTGKNEREYRLAMTKMLDYGVKDTKDGLPVKMTKMQAMQILMTAEREAHNDKVVHLQRGGATIRNAIDIQNGKGAAARSYHIEVTPELVQKISDSLTAWDKEYIQTVREYFAKEIKATNEVLYKLKHRVLQSEEYYIPYKVDNNYLETRLEGDAAMNMWVKTPGSTNALQIKAGQPVIIDGLDSMLSRHVKDTANYVGLALPIRDFSKVYNGQLSQGPDTVPVPVKDTINDNFGDTGLDILKNAVIDVQGLNRVGNYKNAVAEYLNKLQGAFVKSALLINPSVTIKQAASYIAAESVISHRALEVGNRPIGFEVDASRSPSLIAQLFLTPGGRTATRIFNEIDQYTSMHYVRRQGMSYTELADKAQHSGAISRTAGMIGANLEQSKAGHYVRKAGQVLDPTTWIQRMDVATTAALWVACKEQAKLDGKQVGSAEYWQRTTELYERCLRETQPMYDSLHRTNFQKDRTGILQFLFPFRTVPVQNHGQIASSFDAMLAAHSSGDKARLTEARKHFAKTVWAQTESAFIFSVMTALAAGLKRKTRKYRDEDEELTWNSLLDGILRDTAGVWVSNLLPLTGSELWSWGSKMADAWSGKSGYNFDTFSVGIVDMLNELDNSFTDFTKATGKLERGDIKFDAWADKGLDFLLNSSKIFGIPAPTIKTYYEGLKGNILDMAEGRFPALNDESWVRSTSTDSRRFIRALEDGNTIKAKNVLALMKKNIRDANHRIKEDKLNSKVQNAINTYIHEQILSGGITEKNAIRYMVEYGGKDDEDDAYWAIQEWRAKELHKGEDDYKWTKYDGLMEDIDAGEKWENIKRSSMLELTDHGVKPETVYQQITEHIRDRFKAGELSEDEAMELMQAYSWKKDDKTKQYRRFTASEAYFKLEEWKAKAADPEDSSWSQYDAMRDALRNGGDGAEELQDLLDHDVSEASVYEEYGNAVKNLLTDGTISSAEAQQLLLDNWKVKDSETKEYRKPTENEIWKQTKRWAETAEHEGELDYSYSQYDTVDEAISAGKDISGLVKDLTDHGIKQEDVNSHIKTYLVNQYVEGKTNEMGLKNQLSHYLGLAGGEDRDEIVRDANCKKLTGYDYDNLGKGYKAGKIPSQTVTKALTQYGGMSSSDAKARVRYWDFQKSYPDSNLGQTTLDKYYDTTIENVGKTLKNAGISMDTYVRYAEAASKAKGTDKDGDGKTDSGSKKAAIMQIIDGLSLTPQQKDALYYFNGWAASKIREAPWH